MELQGATALITGANRGIGRAIAEALAREPLALLLAGARTPCKMEPIVPPRAGARDVRAVAMDLSSRESIEQSCAALPELDEIDLLVNNAGRMTGGLLEGQELDDIYAMFQVNLTAVTQLTRAVLPGMLRRGRGKIVNNASISGYAYFPAASTYAASKAGVVAFTESLRRELKDTGVSTLHLVTPEFFQTLSIPIVRGRAFDARDVRSGQPSVVVDQVLAGQLWPDTDPVGQTLFVQGTPHEVIGVAQNRGVRPGGVEPGASMFRADWAAAAASGRMLVRVTGDSRAMLPLLRTQIVAVDPTVAVSEALPLSGLI